MAETTPPEEPKSTKTIEELKESSYKLTDAVLSELVDCFQNDFTVQEACLQAGIHPDTFYAWIKESDEFAVKMDVAKQFVAVAAKKVIANAIITNKSTDDAWKLLERRQKKLYSPRHEITDGEGKPITGDDNTLREINAGVNKLLDEATNGKSSDTTSAGNSESVSP